jgi:hypothetical protein
MTPIHKVTPIVLGHGGKAKRQAPFLFLTVCDLIAVSNSNKERGLGRLGNGTFTNYDREAAEERDEAVKNDRERKTCIKHNTPS